MFLTFLLTVIGGSIGSILALGTAWASVKRYFQRTLARHLADIIPRDVPTAVILARNHEGKEKARWMCDILAKSELASKENTTVLDLAGGTHFDLLEVLVPMVNNVHVYDGKVAIEYLTENRPSLLTTGKVTLRSGETVKEALTTFKTDESFDVVLAIDILHAVHPDERHSVICEWARLVKPSGGAIVVVFETEPLSAVSQAGVIQGIFFRANQVAVKSLLQAAGFGRIALYEYPEENRMAIVGIKGTSTPIQDDKSWSQ